jgi:rRNA-processing protein FCF1
MTDDIDTPDEGLPPLATAPEPSRPTRAKRHLRVVPDTPEETDTTGSTDDPEDELSIVGQMTAKQAKFCDGVASGMTLSDAYRAAYDTSTMQVKTVHEAACRLVIHSKVAARLEQISREKEEARRMLTASDAASAIETFRAMMDGAKNEAVRVRAAELLAKAAGVFTDKVEVTDRTDRSVSELEQAIKDRLARLGLTG